MKQQSLFKAVETTLADAGELSNGELYEKVCAVMGADPEEFFAPDEIPSGKNVIHQSKQLRAIRWHQQTLKVRGLIERVPGSRGRWRLTNKGKDQLTPAPKGMVLLAYQTRLGLAVWADCEELANAVQGESIHLYLSSPPYVLQRAKRYGGIPEPEYVDFMTRALEPVVQRLSDGGSIALVIGNDGHKPLSPARSTVVQRLVIALEDRLGLSLMDIMPWHNRCRLGDTWVTKGRKQLKGAYESIVWMTNNPHAVRSDNRRVLEPHSAEHLRRIRRSANEPVRTSSDGAHKTSMAKFSKSAGRIPDNVLRFGSTCGSQRRYKAAAREAGLVPHGAPFPLSLARFLIRFLSEPGDLVADFMAGSNTTGLGAELEGRSWVCGDLMAEYVLGSGSRFLDAEGAWFNPHFSKAFGVESWDVAISA